MFTTLYEQAERGNPLDSGGRSGIEPPVTVKLKEKFWRYANSKLRLLNVRGLVGYEQDALLSLLTVKNRNKESPLRSDK